MSHRFFNVAAFASLILSVGIAALWMRTYSVGDSWYGTTRHADYSLVTGRGRASLAWHSGPRGGIGLHHESARPPSYLLTPGDALGRLGFFYDNRRSADGGSRWAMVFPIGPALIATLLLPVYWTWGAAKRRKPTGHCPVCGYDLRASTGRCPECGRPIEAADVRSV